MVQVTVVRLARLFVFHPHTFQVSWADVQDMSDRQAKVQVLKILSQWQLFGSTFFYVSSDHSFDIFLLRKYLQVHRENDLREGSDYILALNKHGLHFLDLITHETILQYPFTEVISTRLETEDGMLYLDMECGNLMQQTISRIKTDQAVEIERLIKQYIAIQSGITLTVTLVGVTTI